MAPELHSTRGMRALQHAECGRALVAGVKVAVGAHALVGRGGAPAGCGGAGGALPARRTLAKVARVAQALVCRGRGGVAGRRKGRARAALARAARRRLRAWRSAAFRSARAQPACALPVAHAFTAPWPHRTALVPPRATDAQPVVGRVVRGRVLASPALADGVVVHDVGRGHDARTDHDRGAHDRLAHDRVTHDRIAPRRIAHPGGGALDVRPRAV